MKTSNPTKLIEFLKELSQESDKDKMNKKYLEVSKEIIKTKFLNTPNKFPLSAWYRRGIQLSSENYISTGGSEDTKSELLDIIELLENSEEVLSK